MDKAEAIGKVKRYKEILSGHFEIDKLILFGSYAIDKQTEDSDIDVAIVVKQIDDDFFSYAPLLWKLRREVDNRIEPVLIESDKDHSGFLQGIMSYGIVV